MTYGLQNIDSLNTNHYKHYLTEVAEKKIENRDLINMKRSKNKSVYFENLECKNNFFVYLFFHYYHVLYF